MLQSVERQLLVSHTMERLRLQLSSSERSEAVGLDSCAGFVLTVLMRAFSLSLICQLIPFKGRTGKMTSCSLYTYEANGYERVHSPTAPLYVIAVSCGGLVI